MSRDDSWERQAERWARFARSPEHDHFFWEFNGPRFLELLPEPGRLTLDIACGEGRLGRLLRERGMSARQTSALCVVSKSTQPLFALATWALEPLIQELLPAALGLAGGR